jgi:cold shock CspA family protein
LSHIISQGSNIYSRIKGTVIWYSSDEGYGIIRQKQNKKSILIDQSQIHYNAVSDIGPLRVGQSVSFEIDNAVAVNLYMI